MQRNRAWTLASLLFIIVLAAVGLGTMLATSTKPTLGLDLQGGVSVVLAPRVSGVPIERVRQARSIIQQRVDGLGVAEPDVTVQGRNIVIEVAGLSNAKDKDRLLALVGQTAQLRFRSVLQSLPPAIPADPTSEPSTDRAGYTADATVVLPEMVRDKKGKEVELRRYRLGPQLADGTILNGATADFNSQTGQWSVGFTTTGKGAGVLDNIAAANVGKQVAIVLDGVVKSAPTFQTASFGGRGQITGSFTEGDAKDLALVLRYGSLPVELEVQTSQTVSASLGRDSLHAGLVAGAIGLGLVLLYMLVYYRALGVVVVLGLLVSGSLLYTVLSLLSSQAGLTLSLSGATGVIVSVGVTVDSYIVFFERLKDDVGAGKSVRSSVDRSFQRAWRTILVADATSFIGATILYLLAVGPVRGFALNLALSTVLDCVVAWFFTRTMVSLLGRSRFFTEARFFGVARGLAQTSGVPA